MGLNASCCVKQTASGALERRYNIITADQVIADKKEDKICNKSKTWFEINGIYLK